MVPYPRLAHEADRLLALYRLGILDTAPDSDFDAIVRLVAAICETPVALVNLVDAERQWFKAKFGTEVCETSRDVSFCAWALATPDQLFIVPDMYEDPRFTGNSFVTGPPFVRFYAGIPLVTSGGHAIGTICVLDTVPRRLTNEQCEALRLTARVAMILLERRQTITELDALRRDHENANVRLRFLATHDGLTALPNRSHFLEILEAFVASGERDFAVAFVDLDRFKEINDTLGHHAGDDVLVEVARRIRDVARPEETIARLGGDEFTICFRGIPSDDAALTAAARVARELSRPYRLFGDVRMLSASVGLARPRPSSTVSSLMREADAAMYLAKSRGEGAIELYEPELRTA